MSQEELLPSFLFTLHDTKSIGEFNKFFIHNSMFDQASSLYRCYLSKKLKDSSSDSYEQLDPITVKNGTSCLEFIEFFSDNVIKNKSTHDFRCVLVKKEIMPVLSA